MLIQKSELKEICKSLGKRKLEELKQEIIAILKKQEEKDYKKAIEQFSKEEKKYKYLEKSISGEWIEKAGYGIGTVRVWKGKKYKKIAPGKWARMYEKEGRGTNIAVGHLIAKVKKIDDIEELMNFVMQNKQRFQDENGMDLPILDKIRAEVDKQSGKIESKGKSENTVKKEEKYDRELIDSWKDDYKNFSTDVLKEKIEVYTKVLERVKNDHPSPDQRVTIKQNEHRLKALNELLEEKKNKPTEKKEETKVAIKGKFATDKQIDYVTEVSDKTILSTEKMLKKPITTIQRYANSHVEDFKGGVDKFIEYMADRQSEISLDEIAKEWARLVNHNVARKIWESYQGGALEINDDGYFQEKKVIENNPKSIEGMEFVNKNKMHVLANFLANHDNVNMATAVIRLQAAYEKLGEEKFLARFPKEVVERYRKESGKEELPKKEEKQQNRSEAMKGNKNAYKGGYEDEPIHNKVSKNGVYYTFDGFSDGINRSFRQAKDLPQNIKDNINNSVKRYLDYVDNYTDEGYKKVADDMVKNPEKYQHMSMEEFNKETGYDKEDVREIVKLKSYIEFADKLRNFNLDETMISKYTEQNFRDEIYPVSLKQNIQEGFLPNQIADIESQKTKKTEKSKKKENSKNMTPKQQKTFDDFEKKAIKNAGTTDRGKRFAKHNYNIDGEDWTITTDGKVVLCSREKFEEPTKTDKITNMDKIFVINGQKESAIPDGIDAIIKAAPKKVVVGKDYNGKEKKEFSIIKLGDRYFNTDYLKTVQNFLGPLSNAKMQVIPGDNKGRVKFESGNKAVVLLPIENSAELENRIINTNDIKKSLEDIIMFCNDFEDEDEVIEEINNESLFSDYSAENPELFNSIAFKVEEVLNECGICGL